MFLSYWVNCMIFNLWPDHCSFQTRRTRSLHDSNSQSEFELTVHPNVLKTQTLLSKRDSDREDVSLRLSSVSKADLYTDEDASTDQTAKVKQRAGSCIMLNKCIPHFVLDERDNQQQLFDGQEAFINRLEAKENAGVPSEYRLVTQINKKSSRTFSNEFRLFWATIWILSDSSERIFAYFFYLRVFH